jgi:hypothetical protein
LIQWSAVHGPPLRFWVIADDLTGALDTAAPFAAHGWRTCVVPWPGASRPRRAVVAAGRGRERRRGRRHRVAARAPRGGGAPRPPRRGGGAPRRSAREGGHFYKKIDSTLRGNVAAELAAFRAATAVERLPLAPAFSGPGPHHARRRRLGRRPPAGAVGGGAGRPGARGSGDLARLAPPHALDVIDARTDADLRRIAARLAREARLGVVAGSGGLAGAIAARFGSPRRRRRAGPSPAASSSCRAAPSRRAGAGAGARGGRGARADRADRRARRRSAIDAPPRRWRSARWRGRTVVLACPALAAGARVPSRGPRRRGTAGGDRPRGCHDRGAAAPYSPWAATPPRRWSPRWLGAARVEARSCRASPSCGWTRAAAAAGPRWLITKSGAFGDPHTLRRLVRRLTSPPGSETPHALDDDATTCHHHGRRQRRRARNPAPGVRLGRARARTSSRSAISPSSISATAASTAT